MARRRRLALVTHYKIVWVGGCFRGDEAERHADVPEAYQLHTEFAQTRAQALAGAAACGGRAVACYDDGEFEEVRA